MNQPIPRNGTDPLKVGDRVQIVPEWQDPGDERFERFVIEAPPNTSPDNAARVSLVLSYLYRSPIRHPSK